MLAHIERAVRLFSFLLVFTIPIASGGGCTQPAFPTSAIAAAEVAAQTSQTIINDAQAMWPAIKALLPPADQAAAQGAFDRAVFAANHAVLALDDAIRAAIAANDPRPDFGTILSALGDAVNQVVAVVEEFKSKSHVVVAGGIDAVGDMKAAAEKLRR